MKFLFGCIVTCVTACAASIQLPAFITDNLVLPVAQTTVVEGTGPAKATITARYGNETLDDTTVKNGVWQLKLRPKKVNASAPLTFAVSGKGVAPETLTFANVAVGTVWLVATCDGPGTPVDVSTKGAPGPNIRFITAPTLKDLTNRAAPNITWHNGNDPASQPSANAYYFARYIQKKYGGDSPVGIIQTTTPAIEAGLQSNYAARGGLARTSLFNETRGAQTEWHQFILGAQQTQQTEFINLKRAGVVTNQLPIRDYPAVTVATREDFDLKKLPLSVLPVEGAIW